MNTAERDTKQGMEENDVLKQFIELLGQQNMGEQTQELMALFQYVAGMQLQLGAMVDELQGVREQLAQMQENQPKAVTEQLMDKVAYLQARITSLSERLTAVKDRLVETAEQALSAFKEKGKAEVCKVVQKGISAVKSMLENCQVQMVDVMTDFEKTANQIDSIGDELKQIGNSVSNVGRLLAGKGTKEVSDEKPGVGLTRAVSQPVKNAAVHLRENIDAVDRMMGKLDSLSDRMNTWKEAEKGGRTSLKDKLSQMKEIAGKQTKAPAPDKVKAECL